jgi:hypothetical protein
MFQESLEWFCFFSLRNGVSGVGTPSQSILDGAIAHFAFLYQFR